MMAALPIPTVEDVEYIAAIQDPVIRNLLITQCYHELSAVFAASSGPEANWCTFATWASKQAGQSIRKEDLARLLESQLSQSPDAVQASLSVAAKVDEQGGRQVIGTQPLALGPRGFVPALERVSDAIARGNKKVFEEIGHEFARFYQSCFSGHQPDPQQVVDFCEALHPGESPDGQSFLRRAFTHYAQALGENDIKARAELILLANIEIGFHEQTRLQPEIAESLDAGMVSFLDFARALFHGFFPFNGWFHLAHLYLMRLLGRSTALDRVLQSLLSEVKIQLRRAITEIMMTISLPSGVVLRLGQDLADGFPQPLQRIANPELRQLLQEHDPTPDSPTSSGAVDWANLPDRLHFIIDLFRCYQERASLFEPPFTPEQVATMKDGRIPQGRL